MPRGSALWKGRHMWETNVDENSLVMFVYTDSSQCIAIIFGMGEGDTFARKFMSPLQNEIYALLLGR